MQLKVLQRQSKRLAEFSVREGEAANIEHFGRPVDWRATIRQLIAEDRQRNIIGSLKLEIQAEVGYVDTLIVAKNHRGEGLGTQLTLKAEQLAKEAGAHKIYLETGKTWAAVKFYQSRGYTVTGEHPRHYFGQDFIIFSKSL
jgi:ribosomal protein S18 acetylase RimI-like enzyme